MKRELIVILNGKNHAQPFHVALCNRNAYKCAMDLKKNLDIISITYYEDNKMIWQYFRDTVYFYDDDGKLIK